MAFLNNLKLHRTLWILSGLLLIANHWLLRQISASFAANIPRLQRPYGYLIALLVTAGILYLSVLAVLYLARRMKNSDLNIFQHTKFKKIPRAALIFLFAVGLIMRLLMIGSYPIHEDDWNRFLWDGAVLANGINPYRYPPETIEHGELEAIHTAIPPAHAEKLYALADQSEPVISNVNYPELRTVYPPVTEAVFVAAYWIKPFSLDALRAMILLLDLAMLAVILLTLKQLKLPLLWCIIYWWNPVVTKEFLNSTHVDLVPMLFVMLAILFSVKNKHITAAAMVALGVSAKIWPLLILPIVLRPLLAQPKKLIVAVLLFTAISVAAFLPDLLHRVKRRLRLQRLFKNLGNE